MEHNPNENEAIGVDGKHWGLNCTTWVVHQDLENYVNEGRKYQCHDILGYVIYAKNEL